MLPVGAPVETSFETELGGCATPTPFPGEVVENGLPTDTVRDFESGAVQEASCTDEYEGKRDQLNLELDELSLSSKGKVKIKASMDIAIYGMFGSGTGCDYIFTLRKAKASIQVPAPGKAGEAIVTGVAKSENKHANKACPKKEEPTFTLTVADKGGFPLETTLKAERGHRRAPRSRGWPAVLTLATTLMIEGGGATDSRADGRLWAAGRRAALKGSRRRR